MQQIAVESAIEKAIQANDEGILSLVEELVMPWTFIPGRWEQGRWVECQFIEDDTRLIVDYEPEKMVNLVINGNIKIGTLVMYRTACEHEARIDNGLDKTREWRYNNVVAALALLTLKKEQP